MALINLFKSRRGFTYTELIVGMSILLLGLSFIAIMYRYSSQNRVYASELTAMATVAQNMAEVYKAISDTNEEAKSAALAEASSEGFTAGKAEVDVLKDTSNGSSLYKVTITVHPRVDIPGFRSNDSYVYVFYTMDKSKLDR